MDELERLLASQIEGFRWAEDLWMQACVEGHVCDRDFYYRQAMAFQHAIFALRAMISARREKITAPFELEHRRLLKQIDRNEKGRKFALIVANG